MGGRRVGEMEIVWNALWFKLCALLGWEYLICLTYYMRITIYMNSKYSLLLSYLTINISPDFAYIVYFRGRREIVENLHFLIFWVL